MTQTLFGSQPFYHQSVRKLVTAFGALFSGMNIIEYDDDCKVIQHIKVPVAYGPKSKWLERLREQPDLTAPRVKVTMPRISFEITDYRYDPTRKIGTQGAFIPGKIGESMTKVFNPVPYDLIIKLYTYAKDNDDSLQMMEQILPYFTPSLNLNINYLPEVSMMKSIPIQLDAVAVDDNYADLSVQTQRTVVQTFSFTAKMDFFGPIFSTDKIIKRTIVDIATKNPMDIDLTQTVVVDPFDADKEDPHTIIETWDRNV
jgi:hypothetical protein